MDENYLLPGRVYPTIQKKDIHSRGSFMGKVYYAGSQRLEKGEVVHTLLRRTRKGITCYSFKNYRLEDSDADLEIFDLLKEFQPESEIKFSDELLRRHSL